MARVTELRIRSDWGLVKFAYLPALAAGLASSKFLWPIVLFSFRIHLCGLCILLARWGHHVEEWFNSKPLLQIDRYGLLYEDGGEAVGYAWSDIRGVVMHRRNPIPFWRTNGSTEITPPFWLAITVSEAEARAVEQSSGYGYRLAYDCTEPEPEEPLRTICVWPRQVEGGLFSLMRFAKELQGHLLEVADRGEIPKLLPKGTSR